MSIRKTVGGDRIGAGKKMTVDLKSYERSTHDLSYLWRSTMAPGTLVPFMNELVMPGDTFDIDLDCDIMTHPTIGPLFGSYKVQLDIFLAPLRLYIGMLNYNKLNIGLNMENVKLPQIRISAENIIDGKNPDNQQINPSCILAYLGIRGIGRGGENGTVYRDFNAVPYIAYWDIYKNYYSNKQEEIGAVIHNAKIPIVKTIISIGILNTIVPGGSITIPKSPTTTNIVNGQNSTLNLNYTSGTTTPNPAQILLNTNKGTFAANYLFRGVPVITPTVVTLSIPRAEVTIYNWRYIEPTDVTENSPQVLFFPLENIDIMREDILQSQSGTFMIDATSSVPYLLPLIKENDQFTKLNSLEGLALKTYQSDKFNNWLNTETIDGDNGINAISAVDVSDGTLKIDSLILARKVFDMLNRIAMSGGTYDDYMEVQYTHNAYRKVSTPMYMGGLIKELVFQEVISNSEAEGSEGTQPLGTLAGRGVMGRKHKGGHSVIKVDEMGYIIGLVSLTPRVDYSQGNRWDVNLKTMADIHVPALDEIGFQDLITDEMAFWDTYVDPVGQPTFKSAGKQPAWINYQTNYNRVYGNFAIEENEMFMTLNRRYEFSYESGEIVDVTTYIDPMKFNHIFADTARDAQNFWVQIGVDIIARRKMSARLMPNL